jgi:lysophospholipase L1-like esterase
MPARRRAPVAGRRGRPRAPASRALLALLVASTAIACAQDPAAGRAAEPVGHRPSRTTAPSAEAAATAAACPDARWVGSWATAHSDGAGPRFADETLRLVVRPTLGGRRVRVRLSNVFGPGPVTFGAASVARRRSGAAVVPGTSRRLRFGGRATLTLPAGGERTSDAVSLPVRPFQDLAVSLHVRGSAGPASRHAAALQTSYRTPRGSGDRTADAAGTRFTGTLGSWPYLAGVDVRAPGRAGAVVTIGDSITDGFGSTPDGNRRYPDVLARRLATAGRDLAVLNAGISGNRLLAPGRLEVFGPSLLDRLDRDVIAQPGVTDAIVLAGTNDLGHRPGATAAAVIAGLETTAARLRAAGVRPVLATQTPSRGYAGGGHGTGEAIAARNAVNDWIRRSGLPFADLHAATRDLADPDRLRPAYDTGDGLHPNDAGLRAMARAVRLSLLRGPACRSG